MTFENLINKYKKNNPILFLTTLSFAITFIIILFILLKKDNLKNPEKYLSQTNFIILYLNRFIHWFTFVFLRLYIFIISEYNYLYDSLYIGSFIIIRILWSILFKGECFFSVNEKQILYKNYKAGTSINIQPYILLLFPDFKGREIFAELFNIITIIIPILIITYRFILHVI